VEREDLIRRGLEAARRAIELNPKLPEGYKAQALVLRFSGDKDGSIASLHKALEADPRFTPALMNIAVDAYCRANIAGAERYIRRALEVDPQETFAMLWAANITMETQRTQEAVTYGRLVREHSRDRFYITASYSLETEAHILAGDLDAAEQSVREALAAGAVPAMMRTFEAKLAARRGRLDEAKRLVDELADFEGMNLGAIMALAGAAVLMGNFEVANRLCARPIGKDLAPIFARLDPELRALLDHAPFAPRRMDATLVWPLEAPMIDRATFKLFRDVKIESGLPEGSDLR
jgi:Flp pilus assembly protein TadD